MIENPTPDSKSDGVDQDEYTIYGNMWLLSNYPKRKRKERKQKTENSEEM
jgi:hypothetical protein